MRALVLALALTFLPSLANAAEAQFICFSVEAAEKAAKAVVDNGPSGETAQPFLESGECLVLPVPVEFEITYRGKVFKGKVGPTVQVVGHKAVSSDDHEFYGLMPLEGQDA